MNSTSRLPASFFSLVTAQSLGALNDNLFKLLVIFQLILIYGVDKLIHVSAMAGAIFVIPYILFSPFSGILSDRYNKLTIFKLAKVAEIGIMACGMLFFSLQNATGLYVTLFLTSLHGVIIGPAKNGVLPDLVGSANLTKANGLMVTTSYGAIIIGTVLAAVLSSITHGSYSTSSSACLFFAVAGAITAYTIPSPCKTNVNHDSCTYQDAVHSIISSPSLFAALIASAFFLFIGAFVQLSIIPYGMQVLHLNRESSSYIFLLAAFGIGTGAFIAGKYSHKSPNSGLMFVGSTGIALVSFSLIIWGASTLFTCIFMTLLGFFGGLLIVPVNTFIQHSVTSDRRGKILGISYLLNFTFILAAAGALEIVAKNGLPTHRLFIVPMIIGTLLSAGIAVATPRNLIRLLVSLVVRCRYSVRVHNAMNIPESGAAIIAFNHISWIDGLIVIAAIDRPMHFFMKRSIFNTPLLRQLFQLFGIHPIAFSDGPHALSTSIDAAKNILAKGGCIGIFPEGAISHTGFIQQCKGGYQKMASSSDAPVIPAYINGLWGSAFSYYGGKLFASLRIFSRRSISVTIGIPLSASVSPSILRSRIEMCGAEAAKADMSPSANLATSFIRSARRHWHQTAMCDTTGKNLTYIQTLIFATALSNAITKQFPQNNRIGIMLPASVGGSLINISVALSGKVSVNLNFTASDASIRQALTQSGCTVVISSRQFIQKLKRSSLQLPYLFIEDILPSITHINRFVAIVKTLFFPAERFNRSALTAAHDCATIIFSSGSTSKPKGIMLSHANLLANTNSMHQAIYTNKDDAICAALPFFHSFGITATLWFPMLYGFKACYHPNPLDGDAIANLVEKHHATILLATPTFLKTYLRKATPEAFASLKLVITGAEKLRATLANDFYNKFHIVPLEGYGATELSPVVSLNVPDATSHGKSGKGSKPGTIGRPIPGIAARIIDPDTRAEITKGTGLLLVKGANVMMGYLDNTEATQAATINGWYVTGDIASVDDEGFITLHDRLSRFSKLGGEMVSHGAIEDILYNEISNDEHCIAVTSIGDPERGEKIVVVYTNNAGTPESLSLILDHSGIPNLWKPAHDSYISIDAIPLLGTGKMDLKRIKEYAGLCLTNDQLKRAA